MQNKRAHLVDARNYYYYYYLEEFISWCHYITNITLLLRKFQT